MQAANLLKRLEGVKEFTIAFKHPISADPVQTIDVDFIKKRIGFIDEELSEMADAVDADDIVGLLDAGLDTDYFDLGTVIGLGAQQSFVEVVALFEKQNSFSVNATDDIDSRFILRHINIMRNELKDLLTAANNNDLQACVSVLAHIYHLNQIIMHNTDLIEIFDKGFDIVQSCNMSKLCSSQTEVLATIAKYQFEEIPVIEEEVLTGKWAVYNKETGKVMKSINYVAPDLKSLFI